MIGFRLYKGKEENLALDRVKKKVLLNDNDFVWVRWPNGKHFYIKYKGMDVIVNGKEKWATEQAALEAVEVFKQEFKG